VSKLFGEEALYIQYTDPGYILFKEVEEQLKVYREKTGRDPAIILLQNHGIFVSAETTMEIRKIYEEVFAKLADTIAEEIPSGELPIRNIATEILPALQ